MLCVCACACACVCGSHPSPSSMQWTIPAKTCRSLLTIEVLNRSMYDCSRSTPALFQDSNTTQQHSGRCEWRRTLQIRTQHTAHSTQAHTTHHRERTMVVKVHKGSESGGPPCRQCRLSGREAVSSEKAFWDGGLTCGAWAGAWTD